MNESITEDKFSEWLKKIELKKEKENTKRIQYLSKLPREKRWNASKHFVWITGITPAEKCNIYGCTCRHKVHGRREGHCQLEVTIFTGVFEKLERELKKNYPKLDIDSFSVQFVIGQIALNEVRRFRTHASESHRGQLIYRAMRDDYENPLLEYDRRLISQTMKLLKNLGLTPAQLIEKESWQISKTIEKTIAKLQVKPSEAKMEKSVVMMEKKPKQ